MAERSENVIPIRKEDSLPRIETGDHTGGNGGGGDMEARVAKLESDIAHIKTTMNDMKSDLKTVTGDVSAMKTKIAVIESNYATKADVTSSANKIIFWVAGAVIFSQLLPAIPKIIDAFIK
ncbi:hypothetical protein [Xenorhabdus ehlersii]|uniref:Hemolysin XhlA n=1 Tax=Xenorhabdus ehlersii TaxID=290111 RepID=A0A2D0IPF9_9GAMM|nr:hypothetical protein [Xenorhabdus ehlersii]PHM23694.1 hypothetical protein Xehl_02696 [Xenorhabdus ehlersii]RKE92702.1 hypothetical protein BDE27_0359 [Xenorhabdus ehlersii]